MEFGIKDRSVSTRFQGHVSALGEYLRELPEAMQYWIGGLALIGLWQIAPPRLASLRLFLRSCCL